MNLDLTHPARTALLALATLACLFVPSTDPAAATAPATKVRIAVVSSYHRDYLWSSETNRGVVAGLLAHGYLDDESQGETFTRDDFVESSSAIVTKLWMDTKRRNTRREIGHALLRVVSAIDAFEPDVLLLGDDNAVNHVGNHFVDTDLDIVIWGVNGSPLKYDLFDSLERPGHNVTGVYQAGYLREGIEWLGRLVPGIRRMAVLSDASPTGRSKAKELARLADEGALPVEIVASVVTDSYEEWQAGAIALADEVDAFVVLNHNTLEDAAGNPIDSLEAGAWYLRHVARPEVAHERQFVVEGMLSAVDDSGYKQGYEAVRIAHRIIADGARPADIPVSAPERGPFVVNLERARMLGLDTEVTRSAFVEERIDAALALRERP